LARSTGSATYRQASQSGYAFRGEDMRTDALLWAPVSELVGVDFLFSLWGPLFPDSSGLSRMYYCLHTGVFDVSAMVR
jgi:hypothetical protein